jgi:protoporphyrinogen oxidase
MIIIAGGGISGLTLGRHLSRDFLILEKNKYPGGLSTQYKSSDYWYDFGGHYFHFQGNPELKRHLLSIDKFKTLKRNSKIFLLDRYIPFPVQFHLAYLPKKVKSTILQEILAQKPSSEVLLSEHLKKIFGRTLYRLFFEPFLDKFYQKDFLRVLAGKDKGSIPVPDKDEVLKGYHGKRFTDKGYNTSIYYPRGNLAGFIHKYQTPLDFRLKLDEEILKIDLVNKRVFCKKGSYDYKLLINTLPLKDFLEMTLQKENFPRRHALSHISTKIINLTLKKRLKRFHWVYLPAKEFSFYRVGYYPYREFVGCYMESTTERQMTPGQDQWRKAVQLLKKFGMIEDKNDILHCDEITIPISYIIHDKEWSGTVSSIIKDLRKYDVYTTGRYGKWHYSSMSEDVKDATDLARRINNGSIQPLIG